MTRYIKIFEPVLEDTQNSFHRRRSTTDQTFTLQQIFKTLEYAKDDVYT